MEIEGRVTIPPELASGAEVAFVCDEDGSVLESSETVGRVLGLPADVLRGRPLADLAVGEDGDVVKGGLAEARRGGTSRFSARLVPRVGPPIEAEFAAWSVEARGRSVTLCLTRSDCQGLRRMEERTRHLADTQKTIATILALALEDVSLDEVLRRALDLILSIPWLSIERKGAIFLVEHEPATLVMKVNRGLSNALLTSCAHVSFGTCMCGLAAMERKPAYAPVLDERHTTRYPGIVEHGHYCVPISSDGTTLGVITTYLTAGHERSEIELEFLTAVANALAGILIRRRADAERQRAELASRAKSEFLALVSHELLTPVTAVMLSCERLERDRESPLAASHAEILWRMEGALARLASTIRLLIEHARLEGTGPSIRLEPVNLAELAATVVEEVRPLAHRKGLAVRLAIDAPVPKLWTDERLLKVVLANLASNAVKFTKVGSVVVKVDFGGGAHRVAVEDTGPGIPPEERARIFEPFEPLEPLARKHVPGMGLGLALAYRLAMALGGRLELEPAHGRGSTFVVTLPEVARAKDARALH